MGKKRDSTPKSKPAIQNKKKNGRGKRSKHQIDVARKNHKKSTPPFSRGKSSKGKEGKGTTG